MLITSLFSNMKPYFTLEEPANVKLRLSFNRGMFNFHEQIRSLRGFLCHQHVS